MTKALIIHPNVMIGDGADIGEWVILGMPAHGDDPGKRPTRIGAGAVVRSHSVIYAGNIIGDRFQAGHGVLVRESNRIGHDVSVGSHSIIEHHVEIADGVRIHSNAFIPEFSVLDENAWIGPGVIFTNARYPRSRDVKEMLKGPHVKAGAKIGAGAVLLPGVTIGRDALIGAGAVLVRDVQDGAVVVGNPGRVVGLVGELDAYGIADAQKD